MRLVRCRVVRSRLRQPDFDEAHYQEVYASQDYQDIVRDLGIKSHDYRVRALRPRARRLDGAASSAG